MGGTVASASPMDVSSTGEFPLDEMIIHDEVTSEPEPDNPQGKQTQDNQSMFNKGSTIRNDQRMRQFPQTSLLLPKPYRRNPCLPVKNVRAFSLSLE